MTKERAGEHDPAEEDAGHREAHRDRTREHPAQHGGGIVPVGVVPRRASTLPRRTLPLRSCLGRSPARSSGECRRDRKKRSGPLRDCSGVTEPSRVCLVGQPSRDDAFEEFFGAEYPTLCRALALMAGDALEAQDLAQEAFARVYERWDRVAAMDSPGGYLYRVALNLHRKRAKRLRRPAAPPLRPRHEADPSEVIQARAEVARVLAALPLGQRQALVLTEWLGLDAAEAAARLGIKAASVRVRVHRAKRAVREQFGEPDE